MSLQSTTAGGVWYLCKICTSDRGAAIFPTRDKLAAHKLDCHGIPLPAATDDGASKSDTDKQPAKRLTNGTVNDTPAPACVKNKRMKLRRRSLIQSTSGSDGDKSGSSDSEESGKISVPERTESEIKKPEVVEPEPASDLNTQNTSSHNSNMEESSTSTTLALPEIASSGNGQHQDSDTTDSAMQSELTPPQSVSVGDLENSDAACPPPKFQTPSSTTTRQLRKLNPPNNVDPIELPNIKTKTLTPPTPFVCGHCGKSLTTKADLVLHELRHKKPLMFMKRSPSYRCGHCERVFSRSDHLARHVRIHTGENPYWCKFCPCTFSRHDSIMSHIRRFHSGALEVEAGVKPYIIRTGTTTSINNASSASLVLVPSDPSMTANVASSSKAPRNLMLASKTGTDRKVPRKVATRSASSPATACRHHRSRPTPATPVAKEVSTMQTLTPSGSAKRGCSSRARSSSLAVPNLTCDQCGKIYSRSDKLADHKRSHTGETPYGCRFCGAKFGSHRNVMYHINRHHGAELEKYKDKPYTLDTKSNNPAPSSSKVEPNRKNITNVTKKKTEPKTLRNEPLPYRCKFCSYKFASEYGVMLHALIRHRHRFVDGEQPFILKNLKKK